MNVNEQTTSEVVGSATMAVTFLLSLVTMVIFLIVDIESTNLVRALITEASMLLTIFMWNNNNNQLREHTKEMINKIGIVN